MTVLQAGKIILLSNANVFIGDDDDDDDDGFWNVQFSIIYQPTQSGAS